MGSNTSKNSNDASIASLKKDPNTDSSDPRSPTPEIVRTPLQGKNGAKHNITKNVDLRKTFESTNGEEKLIHNNPILSAVIKNHLQSYDPRSPTHDFERTPIVISNNLSDEKSAQRLQSENSCGSPCLHNDDSHDSCEEAQELSPELAVPKNLCQGFFDISLNDTLKEEPLGSSTISNEAIENDISKDRKKPTQLLETNFDYVSDSEKFEDTEESLQDTTDKSDDNIIIDKHFKILEDDPRSPSTGIERTPIVVGKLEDRVEDMSDDTLIKVLQIKNEELRQTGTKAEECSGETMLIYEDEPNDMNETPKKSKSASKSGPRTPLSCMKNKADAAHMRSKSANTAYDPKTQKMVASKIPKRVSYIPRLKTLNKHQKLIPAISTISLKTVSKASAVSGDCENTPPHSHRDRWDKDTSIVL